MVKDTYRDFKEPVENDGPRLDVVEQFATLCYCWNATQVFQFEDPHTKKVSLIHRTINDLETPMPSNETLLDDPTKMFEITSEFLNNLIESINQTDDLEKLAFMDELSRRLIFNERESKNPNARKRLGIAKEQNKALLKAIRSRIDALEKINRLSRFFRNAGNYLKDM